MSVTESPLSTVGSSYTYTWLDGNLHKMFPLAYDVSGSYGGFTIPQEFLADLLLVVPPLQDTGCKFFIGSIDRAGGIITIDIYCKPSQEGSNPFLCARSAGIDASWTLSTQFENKVVEIFAASSGSLPAGFSDLVRICGKAVIGTGRNVSSGLHSMTVETAEIDGSRICTAVAGLSGVSFSNYSSGTGEVHVKTFTEDFSIIAGDGVSFSTVTDGNGNVIGIQVDRVLTAAETAAGSGQFASYGDAVDGIKERFGNPIYTINGVAPVPVVNTVTAGGVTTTYTTYDIGIAGGDCTTVTSVSGGITISNPCSRPCCDTGTPADVQSALDQLAVAKDRLLSYYESLSTSIREMQSRLSSLIATRSK